MEQFENTRNPILPLNYHIPDSEGHVQPDGKLHIYGSYDERSDVYCSEKHYVVSTKDMRHWEISDIAVKGEDIPWNENDKAPRYPGSIDWSKPTPFVKKMLEDAMKKAEENGVDIKASFEKSSDGPKPKLLFAPDCLSKNGIYYMYICGADDREGVVRSTSPDGPFTAPVQLPCGGIDPAIFIDTDGQAYYYWGQLHSHGVKLAEDMVHFDGEVHDDLVTEEQQFFHEGSSMRKIGDTYYYAYADMEKGKPTSIGYSTGKTPFGPFTYGGVIVNNEDCDPQSWNNHGSIECVDGQWYVFYHRCSRNTQQNRRLCIDKITVLPDGSIPEIAMTSQGVGDPFQQGETLFGYQACAVHGGCYIDLHHGLTPKEAHLTPDHDDPEGTLANKAMVADTNQKYPEKLTGIVPGSEAIWRYITSENGTEKLRLVTSGNGTAKVLIRPHTPGSTSREELLSKPAREVAAIMISDDDKDEDGLTTADYGVRIPAGEWELTLRFPESTNLELFAIQLL